MATLTKKLKGKTPGYEIRFYEATGRLRTIYLGSRRYSKTTAGELTKIVTKLEFYRDNPDQTPDEWVLKKIAAFSPKIREKLGKAGLIEIPQSHTLKELWDAFLEYKARELNAGKIKESTYNLYDCIGDRFFLFFEPDELLEEVDKDRAQVWKDHLLEEVAEATVACYIKETKACFNWAVNQKWISKSPFDGVSTGSFVNKKKTRLIPMGAYYRLLDACPCRDWRCIVSLARIGGLRAPHEVLGLRWEDVNWEQNRFYVRSPKTERYGEEKAGRWVPLFPELREELEALWSEREAVWFELPESKRQFVINRYRSPKQNLRTTFEKIVHRAGLPEIPSPFRNLRKTRSNEVERRFGKEREAEWIGHSYQVWQEHYSEIMDSDFEAAAIWATSDSVEQSASNKCEKSSQKVFTPKFTPVRSGIAMHGAEGVQRANQR